MKNNKRIGLIGGIGPQATANIYRRTIEFAQKKYGAKNNEDYPDIVIASVPVPDFISDTTQINRAKDMLIRASNNLIDAGSTILAIGSNTVHVLLEEIARNSSAEFISMVKLVAERCVQLKVKTVGLLGSPVLVESRLYNKELNSYSIKVIVPTREEERVVDHVIRGVIAGIDMVEEKQEYIDVLRRLFDSGAEEIILGCTELPLVMSYEDFGNRVISSDEVLAEGLVDYYYDLFIAGKNS